MTLTSPGAVDIAVLNHPDHLDLIERDWDALHAASRHATPFQSWPWLRAWWDAYGDGKALRLITVRHADRLVGALPLTLEPSRAGGRLRLAGTGVSDHLDGLAEAGREDEVAAAWAEGLRRLGGWAVADLQEVAPDAVAWRLHQRWRPSVAVPQSACLERRAADWDELLAPMSRNSRSQVRRSLRAAERAGVRPHPPADVREATDELLEGHRRQWRHRGITEEHLTGRFRWFLREAVAGLAQRGGARLLEFRDERDETAARVLLLVGHDYVGEYMYSATPDALKRWHITALWMHAAAELAQARDVPAISFLRGEEPFKQRWAPERRVNHRILLGRSRPAWALEATYHQLRARAAAYVKSESAPDWIAAVAERVRAGSRR